MGNYGWRPSLPDIRDHIYTDPQMVTPLPVHVDLRPQCPPVYDQGHLGSCTAHAIAGAIEFDLLKQQLPDFMPSRLFIYYNERAKEGTVMSDAGAAIRDGIKSVNTLGVCFEAIWPYDITRFTVRPPQSCYTNALLNRTLSYQRVIQVLFSMRAVLASGLPIVLGFTVYESFESDVVAQTGVVPLPSPDEAVLGGHAIVVVGYDSDQQTFTVRNSWGDAWGDQGYCYMPFDYLTNPSLASDFWVIRTVA